MERLEDLNKRLIDHFSVAWNGEAIFRIVWSEDQFEKQRCEYSEKGILLLYPEIREVPKYRQWIHNKFVLERLVAVPSVNTNDLTTKVSYEPLFVFEDKDGNALPPRWEAAKFVIDNVMAAQGNDNLTKYADKNEPIEVKEERINRLQEELFGNETNTGDALAHGQGVAGFYPNNDMKNKVTID